MEQRDQISILKGLYKATRSAEYDRPDPFTNSFAKIKPGFHLVFDGLYGSLRVAGFAESFSVFYDL